MKIKEIILEVVIFIFCYSVFRKLIEYIPWKGVLGNFFFLVLMVFGVFPSIVLTDLTYKYMTNNVISKKKKWLILGGVSMCILVVLMLLDIFM